MASADELYRIDSARTDFEMKFYVGGKWSDADLDNIAAGDPYTATVSTTLAEAVDPEETDIDLASVSGLTTGAVMIHPDSNNPYYEIVSYTGITSNTLNGCTRKEGPDADDPMFGYHDNGATVSEWVDITDIVLSGSDRDEKRGPIISWSATVSGIEYDSMLLDNDNSMLCMARWRPGAGGDITIWSTWRVYWVGYLYDVEIVDDFRRGHEWVAKVEGITQYLSATDMEACSYGRIDLAEGGTASSSSELLDPYDELGSGEFIGSPDDFSADKAVDNDMGTLWISEGQPAMTEEGFASGEYWIINEFLLRAQPGYTNAQHQWIETVYKNNEHDLLYVKGSIVNKATTWAWTSGWSPPGPERRIPTNNYIMIKPKHKTGKMRMDMDGSFGVYCRDEDAFLERWGQVDCEWLIDWDITRVGTFEIDVDGDFLGMHYENGDRYCAVWFGSITPHDYQGEGTGSGWSGATLPTDLTNLPKGHTYRRDPAGTMSNPDTAASWTSEDHPTPGSHFNGWYEWLSVDLGTMGITLGEFLPLAQTTYALLDGTLGFTEAGRIQVDSEQIDYVTRDDGNIKLLTLTRGVDGTTPADHNQGATVYQVEGGIAYTAPLVTMISWLRREVYDGTTLVVPQVFDVYVSTDTSPMYPDDQWWDDDWEDDWSLRATETDWADVSWEKSFEHMRARHMMITVKKMTNGGRAKLNEFRAYAYTTEVGGEPDPRYPDMTWTGDVIADILENKFGWDSSLITLTDRGLPFIGLPIARQTYLTVMQDLLQRTGCMLRFNRDHTVEHLYDSGLPLAIWPDIEVDWTTVRARQVTLQRPYRHNVKQLILRAEEPSTSIVYEVRFPKTPQRLGEVLQIDDMVVGGMENAILLAEMLFADNNSKMVATVIPVGLADRVAAGDRHTITWVLDEQNTYLSGKNFLLIGVDRNWDFGAKDEDRTWSVVLQLEEMPL